jgi:hypothetical protein
LIEEQFDVEEEAPHEDEVFFFSPPFLEVIQDSNPPAQEEENVVSYFPFQILDDALLHDSENEEVLEEPLDALFPSCYNESDDLIGDIDEFIHVGIRKWDVTRHYFNGHPIYDIEGYFQLLSLEQPYVNDLDVWKHEDEIITDLFQLLRDGILQQTHDDFLSHLEGFDTYSFENLDLFYEENFQPPLCYDFDEGNDMIFQERDFLDEGFQPYPFSP